MDFQFGADVIQVDGTKLGALLKVVYEPTTGRVPTLVVEHISFDDRHVLLPITAVITADDVQVEVDITLEEFDSLPDSTTDRNTAPPPDAAYAQTDSVRDPDVPDVPAVGAASGVESIAFTPIIEESSHVPVGDEVIGGDTTVYSTNGEVGRVKVVSIDDDTTELDSLIVESGFFPVRDLVVTSDLIEAVHSDTIVLTVAKGELPSLYDEG